MGKRRGGVAAPASPPAAAARARLASPPANRSGGSSRARFAAHVALALLAAAAAALACAPVTRNHAVYDDSHVLPSRDLHTPWREWLATGLLNDFWGSPMNSATSTQQWRPALVAGYRASLALAGCRTEEVAGAQLLRNKDLCEAAQPPRCLVALHAHSVALHSANTALLHAVAAGPLAMPPPAAAAAALLFGLHPVHAESVAAVYGRADVQALTWQLLALLAAWHLRRRPAVRAALALSAATLATLSKENGLLTFVLLPAVDLLDGSGAAARVGGAGGTAGFAASSLACLGFFVAARAALVTPWGPPFGFVDNPAHWLASAPLRAASLAWLHFRYVEALALPWRLSANHGWDSGTLITSLTDTRVVLCMALYAGAAAATALLLLAARTSSAARSALFCILWGVLAFLPSSNLMFPVGTTLGERLLYLPSAPFCAVTALAVSRLFAGVPPAALVVGAPLAAALLGARLRAELAPYLCDATLWAYAVARYPDNLVAVNNLAVRLDTADLHAAALALYDRVEAVWARTERMAADVALRGGVADDFSLRTNAMRRAAAGRAAVLRPLLEATAADPAFYAGTGQAAAAPARGPRKTAEKSEELAVRAMHGYVLALNGRPDPALGNRILARMAALCTRWEALRAAPICAQAVEQFAKVPGGGAPRVGA